MPIEEFIADLASRVFVSEFNGFGAEPLRVDDADQAVRKNPLHRSIRPKLFKLAHLAAQAPMFRPAFAIRSRCAEVLRVPSVGLSRVGRRPATGYGESAFHAIT